MDSGFRRNDDFGGNLLVSSFPRKRESTVTSIFNKPLAILPSHPID